MLSPVNTSNNLNYKYYGFCECFQYYLNTPAAMFRCSMRSEIKSMLIKCANLRIPSSESLRKVEFVLSTIILK